MAEHLSLVDTSSSRTDPLFTLLELSRRARQAASGEELAFLIVNDTRALCAYRQAALWFRGKGIRALSGVVEPEANAPYAQWLEAVCRHLDLHQRDAAAVTAANLPAELAASWAEWLPAHALWLPFGAGARQRGCGALLLAGDISPSHDTVALLQEWVGAWQHAWSARMQSSAWPWARVAQAWLGTGGEGSVAWWKRRWLYGLVAALIVMAIPVRLSVLAPGELVPAQPIAVRAPLDGVIGQFDVQPNQSVKAGQVLFGYDQAAIAARQEVAAQSLAVAQAEYRQYAQQALSDVRSKAQLAALLGKIEERRAEADYLKDQLDRSRVIARQDGIVLFDDPNEWIGKPVQTGERILRIAAPGDVEVEAWLPIGDAIALPDNAPVHLYLAADPLTALSARVRYVAHDAVPRPDGTYAYRVRARLDGSVTQRVGQKGTAKISGERVPLVYWILRRPWATIRQALGV